MQSDSCTAVHWKVLPCRHETRSLASGPCTIPCVQVVSSFSYLTALLWFCLWKSCHLLNAPHLQPECLLVFPSEPCFSLTTSLSTSPCLFNCLSYSLPKMLCICHFLCQTLEIHCEDYIYSLEGNLGPSLWVRGAHM